jgi:dTMP kinase
MAGKFIVLEGIDGSGKDTQFDLLKKNLKEQGLKAAYFSYPDYGSQFGRIIRNFLASKVKLGPDSQFFLFLADITKDSRNIRELLNKNDLVISKRYVFSSVAYQCAQGLPYDKAKLIVEMLDLPKPTLTILLHGQVKETLERKRASRRGDVFENDLRLMEKVGGLYERMFSNSFFSERWKLFLDSGTKNSISGEILTEVMSVV